MNAAIKARALWSRGLIISGRMSILEHRRLQGNACVLMYHRVLASPASQPVFVQPGMYVTPTTFERQILFLKERFEVLFLDELVQRRVAGKSIAGCCAITFDDGWRDNYLMAFPILKKHAVPATIFLATGFVGTNRLFWPEEMMFYLEDIKMRGYRLPVNARTPAKFGQDIARSRSRSRGIFFERCLNRIKSYSQPEREELFDILRTHIERPQVDPLILTWEEAAEMKQSGCVRFGSHSVNHEMLDQIPSDAVRDELIKSRQQIESHLGDRPEIFAYPNGNSNHTVQSMVEKCGYIGAVTTTRGLMANQSPLMALPRIGIHEDMGSSVPLFRHQMIRNTAESHRFKNG